MPRISALTWDTTPAINLSKKRKRVAVCIAGQGRHIEKGHNVIQDLQKQNPNIEFDVFLQLWHDPESDSLITGKGEAYKVPKDLPRQLELLYKPISFIIDKPIDKITYNHCELSDPKYHFAIESMNFARQRVIESVIASKKKYDLVIMTRYDFGLLVSLDLSSLDPEYLYFSACCRKNKNHMPPPDNMSIMNVENCRKVYNINSQIESFCSDEIIKQEVRHLVKKSHLKRGHEVLLLASIVKNGLVEKVRFLDGIPNFRSW